MSEETLTETDAFIRRNMSLRQDNEEAYSMNNGRRGLALIFNYQQYEYQRNIVSRFGCQYDCSNLEKSLPGLGFEVKVFTNLRKDEVNREIDEAAKADHSDADCFLLVFMSHGEQDYVETYDQKLVITDITDKFKGTNCKSLDGKPKIFIWQACRGTFFDQPCDATNTKNMAVEAGSVNTIPAGADFIMCYSVAKGYFSHREKDKGSWYIQDLCELLQTYGDSLEFTQLLTLVNTKVSQRKGTGKAKAKPNKDDEEKPSKQIPCFASMLTKDLYFHQKQ